LATAQARYLISLNGVYRMKFSPFNNLRLNW
jgi:hypothetical protein